MVATNDTEKFNFKIRNIQIIQDDPILNPEPQHPPLPKKYYTSYHQIFKIPLGFDLGKLNT